ncbi:TIR domain-containing protein [Bosea sp. AK1]|uniref:toll/interleukin-1 receptor domain-containing protein n=1 Tax=Bosea sp. AK1 TaxID=2587160 RepID=UPI000DE48B6B|nr:toll/interleukin-1 receptor domain-containing protein [Bosea sp. AK1]TQI77236.1 TIR domain-containing protein [Bosea sp. AK1]
MAEFITREFLRNLANERSYTEQASIRKSASERPLEGSTFLSHSSKDDELVVGATIILENHGAKVYTDKVDPEMPPYTSAKTAAILKGRIRQTKRFVLLNSPNSKESKWVPWELGIADGYKGDARIALFPSADRPYDMTWAEWEYLGLYSRIVWGNFKGKEKSEWMVWNHRENTADALASWLAGN